MAANRDKCRTASRCHNYAMQPPIVVSTIAASFFDTSVDIVITQEISMYQKAQNLSTPLAFTCTCYVYGFG